MWKSEQLMDVSSLPVPCESLVLFEVCGSHGTERRGVRSWGRISWKVKNLGSLKDNHQLPSKQRETRYLGRGRDLWN